MPQQRRTSILTHVGQIVQNIIVERYAKVIKEHTRKVRALEERHVAQHFDAEAQEVYKTRPNIAATMNYTAWSLQWLAPEDVSKEHTDRISAAAKLMNASARGKSAFKLIDKLQRAAVDGRDFKNFAPVFITSTDTRRVGPMQESGYNTYTRVGPNRHHELFLQPRSAWKKGTEYGAATIFVPDSEWLKAVDLQVRLLEIQAEQIVVSRELIEAFVQRKTIERFIEDFPDLAKHVPHIPEPVRALIVPASAVLARLEAVPAE
jgi:hypothetical protein